MIFTNWFRIMLYLHTVETVRLHMPRTEIYSLGKPKTNNIQWIHIEHNLNWNYNSNGLMDIMDNITEQICFYWKIN